MNTRLTAASQMPRHARATAIASLSLALLASGCARYAAVSERVAVFHPHTPKFLEAAERFAAAARERRKNRPLEALGKYLAEAESASKKLAADPNDAAARDTYNFAVARVIDTVGRAKLDPWSKPLALHEAGGGYVLTSKPDPRPGWNPALYDFTPADQFDVKGTYVADRQIKAGIGAPLVAIGKKANKNAAEEFAMPRVYYGVTALINFRGRTAEISFDDPLSKETVSLAGRQMPLAADFTVPLAVLLQESNPKQMELARMLRPAKYAHTARISRLQPYDPNKKVVMVIHGLMDTPATWAPLVNRLRNDKTIRQNYQFWFYSYPSGYPYAYSASILREQLDAVEKMFPIKKPMVLVGHSMGGCISRLMITDTGDKLWRGIFGKSPAETKLSTPTRDLLEKALVFKHRPEVGRVIFISAPLKGSDLAKNKIGRIGSMLVKAPGYLLEAGADAMNAITLQEGDLAIKRIPNSIDNLAPNNRFVLAVNAIPMTPGIPVNVIAGDRGKGGNRDRTAPVMSDGVVPYWSSHLPQAESEKVVPSNHSAHQNDQAIAEVARILRSHASD